MKTSDELLSWRSVVKGGVLWGGLGAFAGVILEMAIANGAIGRLAHIDPAAAVCRGAISAMMAVQPIPTPESRYTSRLDGPTNGVAASWPAAGLTKSLSE